MNRKFLFDISLIKAAMAYDIQYHGSDLELLFRKESDRIEEYTSWRFLRSSVSALPPALRSALGGIPFTQPDRSY